MSSIANSIKEERQDEAEIRELAARLLEANRNKVAQAAVRSPTTSNLSLTNYFPRKNDKKPAQPATTEERSLLDQDSICGKFGWIQLGKCLIPYIFRSGEKYCAVRMVEMKLLNKYLNYLHQDIYSCTCIRSYYITESESRLLNEINIRHCDHQFGRDMFTTRDLIVRLSDAQEFYNFLDVCYSKLIQGSCNPKDRCGFIRINKESVVPYTIKDDNKYVPLFYFEGETDNLKLKADKLEGWDLSYLKFCCKVQGIRNELFAHDSCAVISLNAIKSYFPPGTGFEDYWPSKVVDSQLLVNGKNSVQVGQWTRQPPTPPAISKCTAKVSQPMQQPAVAMYSGYAGLVGGQPTFQNITNTTQPNTTVRMAHSPARAAYQGPSPASPRPGQRHQFYPPPPMPTQGPPPPLVRSSVPHTSGETNYNPARATSSKTQQQPATSRPSPSRITESPYQRSSMHTSVGPSSPQQNLMMIRDANGVTRIGSFPVTSRPMDTLAQRYPPPLIPVRNINGSPRYHLYPNNTEVVDLSAGQLGQRSQIHNNITTDESSSHMNMTTNGRNQVEIGKKLTIIADTPSMSNHIPYKVQKALVDTKMIQCVNMKPYVSTELLVTLPDIIQHFFPSVSLSSCRRVMDVLNIELYRGNRQQMQILQESGKCQNVTDNLPLVQVHDVIKYMPQMKYMLSSMLNSEPLSKRQRTS